MTPFGFDVCLFTSLVLFVLPLLCYPKVCLTAGSTSYQVKLCRVCALLENVKMHFPLCNGCSFSSVVFPGRVMRREEEQSENLLRIDTSHEQTSKKEKQNQPSYTIIPTLHLRLFMRGSHSPKGKVALAQKASNAKSGPGGPKNIILLLVLKRIFGGRM